jgi:dihydroorotate dehydrogenase electron transfer subunit
MEIFYRVSGKGTVLISRLKADDSVKILGPLGRGFDLLSDRRRVVLIAGGMGIAPLLYLAEYQQRKPKGKEGEMVLYFGALSSQYLCGLDRLKRVCSDVRVSTDDGSMGYHGPVTELFLNEAGSYESDDSAIYACGPYGMMKRVAEIAGTLSIPCQVSVEERMACGIGACLGCAVREGGKNTTPRFKRVCKEGPVFDTRAIDWN